MDRRGNLHEDYDKRLWPNSSPGFSIGFMDTIKVWIPYSWIHTRPTSGEPTHDHATLSSQQCQSFIIFYDPQNTVLSQYSNTSKGWQCISSLLIP